MHAVVQAAYARYLPRMNRFPAPMTETVEELAARSGAWVAELDGRPVGLALVEPAPQGDHLLLETLAVDPDVQGHGIGSRLLAHVEQIALEQGLPEVRLYTNEVMTENLTFYPARGYTETHRGQDQGYRRVYFVKHLTS